MADAPEGTVGFALIEAVAAGLRQELGPAIEEQPGDPDESNTGQVTRAFRVVVRAVLETVVPPGEDLAAAVNLALDRVARRRLGACGLTGREIEHLVAHEARGLDDWLAFLLLTAAEEIELLLQNLALEPDPARPA